MPTETLTPQMIKLLKVAASNRHPGAVCNNYKVWKAAHDNGWIKSVGFSGISTTERFKITPEGAKALEAV
jgi:hypothetical protein